MNVAIIGTGYVGLTTGACLAFLGHDVMCVDVAEDKIAELERGVVPIHEPLLAELIAGARENLRFTTGYAQAIPQAQVVFIAVGTSSSGTGAPNLCYLEAAGRQIGEHLAQPYTVVVNKSTVPIGSGNWVGTLVREAAGKREGCRFAVASNPEFLREGTAIYDSLYADRVVIGTDEERAAEVLYTLYRPVLEQTFQAPSYFPRPEGFGAVPLISTDLASAELIKYSANAFLALKISFINEIGGLAEKSWRGHRRRWRRVKANLRCAHRHQISSGRTRLGWLVFRKGHRGPDFDGGRIRSGNADRRRLSRCEINRYRRAREDRGKAAPRIEDSESDEQSVCSASRLSRSPTICARLWRIRNRPQADRPGSPGAGPRSGRDGPFSPRTPGSGSDVLRNRAGRCLRFRRAGAGHGMARVSRSRLGIALFIDAHCNRSRWTQRVRQGTHDARGISLSDAGLSLRPASLIQSLFDVSQRDYFYPWHRRCGPCIGAKGQEEDRRTSHPDAAGLEGATPLLAPSPQETARLVFHVSPLSNKGLLSQQVRDALKALLHETHGATIVKLRAFVSGSGDIRRVSTIVSETFTEHKLPLPAVSTIEVGALPLEGSQVVIESVAMDKKTMNPNGLAFYSAQPVKQLHPLPGALHATCFLSSLDDLAKVKSTVFAAFPQAVVNFVQTQRLGFETLDVCEAVARLDRPPAQPLTIEQGAALVDTPKIVLTGIQMAFRDSDADLRLAFRAIAQSSGAFRRHI